MAKGMNIAIGEQLRHYIDSRTGDNTVYATPSEYIRDLVRRDMEDQAIVQHVKGGLENIKQQRFSKKSILDIANARKS